MDVGGWVVWVGVDHMVITGQGVAGARRGAEVIFGMSRAGGSR